MTDAIPPNEFYTLKNICTVGEIDSNLRLFIWLVKN